MCIRDREVAMPDIPAPENEVAVISVAAGDGIKNMFLELHCDYVVSLSLIHILKKM